MNIFQTFLSSFQTITFTLLPISHFAFIWDQYVQRLKLKLWGLQKRLYKRTFQFPLVNFCYISVFLSFCLSIFLSIFPFCVCFYVFFRLKSIFDWIFEIPFRRTQSDLSHFLGLNWKLKISPFFILKIFSFLLRHKWWQQQKNETRSTPRIKFVRSNLHLKKTHSPH